MDQNTPFFLFSEPKLPYMFKLGEWQKSKYLPTIRILVQFTLKKTYIAKSYKKQLFAIAYVTHCIYEYTPPKLESMKTSLVEKTATYLINRNEVLRAGRGVLLLYK